MAKTRRRTKPGKPGNPGSRPIFNGLPLPWVARMTSERPYILTGGQISQVAYESDLWPGEFVLAHVDPPHYKDARNIWWMAYTPEHGGKPEFGEITPDRHRRCFDERRCQVCGRIIREPLSWLVAQARLGEPTANAPLHRRCIGTALTLCPHLKRTPYAVLESDEWEPVGVYGDVLGVVPGGVEIVASTNVKLTDPRIMRTMAKQLIVDIINPKEIARRGA